MKRNSDAKQKKYALDAHLFDLLRSVLAVDCKMIHHPRPREQEKR